MKILIVEKVSKREEAEKTLQDALTIADSKFNGEWRANIEIWFSPPDKVAEGLEKMLTAKEN